MPESIPAPLIIDTLKDTFREARAALAAEGVRTRHEHLGWIVSVPDTHQKTVLAALDKERALRVLTCSTEDEANAIAAGLWMGGEPVALMIQHAGQVVTHRQILREVWGPQYVDETHYLRVYIAQLRQKIEADPTRPKILVTEPGVGYRLVTME